MRTDRFHSEDAKKTECRTPAQRDADRITYTPAFRRLAGITQVASTGDSSTLFHNRLTHVIEVAQIGRRMTERLLYDKSQRRVADAIGGIDPDVVQAACLAHDLGHPPFGHVAEEALQNLCDQYGVIDSFEGNAQTFRIVTHLAERTPSSPGLNLTRATLNAVLKYPTMRKPAGPGSHKWNVYTTEETDFRYARELDKIEGRKSAEAEIMDWADDIAYSVTDMADFFRVGKLPLDRIKRSSREQEHLIDDVTQAWKHLKKFDAEEFNRCMNALNELMAFSPFDEPYSGHAEDRTNLHEWTSFLIGRYSNGLSLKNPETTGESFIIIDPELKREVRMLKELVWTYIIRDPALATQQEGYRRVVKGLFQAVFDVFEHPNSYHMLPPEVKQVALKDELWRGNAEENRVKARLTCDIISSLGETQAMELYHRLLGIAPGLSLKSPLG